MVDVNTTALSWDGYPGDCEMDLLDAAGPLY